MSMKYMSSLCILFPLEPFFIRPTPKLKANLKFLYTNPLHLVKEHAQSEEYKTPPRMPAYDFRLLVSFSSSSSFLYLPKCIWFIP